MSDPFVVLKKNGKEVGKTKIVKKNLNPEWHETFKVALKLHDSLEFRLNDYDRFASDDFMGTCVVLIDNNVVSSPIYEVVLTLVDKNNNINDKFTGQLHVIIKKLK